ncbi:cytochrome [Mycolicibacterium litorale]|nr:cytochrome [Mycolicibacterium litorale]
MTWATTVSALARAAWAGIDPDGFFHHHAADTEPFPVRFPGLGTVLFFATGDAARDILTAPTTLCRAPLPNPIEPVVGEHSLILLSGAAHRRARAIVAPAFRGEAVRGYLDLIAEVTAEQVAAVRPGGRLLVGRVAQAITLDVMIRVVFGVADRARHAQYARVTTELLHAGSGPLMLVPWLRREVGGRGPWARLVAVRTQLDRLLGAQIDERRASAQHHGDVMDRILNATDDDGGTLTDTALCDQLRTMLAAGHETSSTSLTWALYHIHRDDSIRMGVLGELATATTPGEFAALPYLNAVISETLRMHPPVPIVLRELTGPYTVDGHAYRGGDVVGIALPAMHFNPRLWPRPDVFDPSRFLDGKPTPFQYAPFGGGYRRCIGAGFAQHELAVVIGTIMTTLQMRLPAGERRRRSPRAVPRGIATIPSREIALQVLTRG